MKTFSIWERQIREQEAKVEACREKIKQMENCIETRGLTEQEHLALMHLRVNLDRNLVRLRQIKLAAEADYNLDAYSRSCPVPMEDEYYERKLKTEGYIVCIKF